HELGDRDRRPPATRAKPVEHLAQRFLGPLACREPTHLRAFRAATFEPVPIRPQRLPVRAFRLDRGTERGISCRPPLRSRGSPDLLRPHAVGRRRAADLSAPEAGVRVAGDLVEQRPDPRLLSDERVPVELEIAAHPVDRPRLLAWAVAESRHTLPRPLRAVLRPPWGTALPDRDRVSRRLDFEPDLVLRRNGNLGSRVPLDQRRRTRPPGATRTPRLVARLLQSSGPRRSQPVRELTLRDRSGRDTLDRRDGLVDRRRRPLDPVSRQELEQREATRLFPSGSGWLRARRTQSTAALSNTSGYNSTPPKPAAGACSAESASPIPGQRAISSAGTPSTASAISR